MHPHIRFFIATVFCGFCQPMFGQQVKYVTDAEMFCNVYTADLQQKCTAWNRKADSMYLDTRHKRIQFPNRDSLSFTYERRTVTESGSFQYFGAREGIKGSRMFLVINYDTGLIQYCPNYNAGSKANYFCILHFKSPQ